MGTVEDFNSNCRSVSSHTVQSVRDLLLLHPLEVPALQLINFAIYRGKVIMHGLHIGRYLARSRVSSRSFHATPSVSSWKSFASIDPWTLSDTSTHKVLNLVDGVWSESDSKHVLPDPLTGKNFIHASDVQANEISCFVQSLNKCSKSGLHNPLKNPQRYLKYGDISAQAAAKMRDPEVMNFFAKLIQRVAPKSDSQALGEVAVTQKFIENFGGDQVRFLARSFAVPGDHPGQMSSGYRWPYGPVVIIAPFNFPLEIPTLQLLGALYMGNKVLLKAESKVSVVMEQLLLLLQECGLPLTDVDFINCSGMKNNCSSRKSRHLSTLHRL